VPYLALMTEKLSAFKEGFSELARLCYEVDSVTLSNAIRSIESEVDELEDDYDMEQALSAIRSVKERHQRTGKWGASGAEFFEMGRGLNHTDEMQKAATRREQLEALRIVNKINEMKQKGQI